MDKSQKSFLTTVSRICIFGVSSSVSTQILLYLLYATPHRGPYRHAAELVESFEAPSGGLESEGQWIWQGGLEGEGHHNRGEREHCGRALA